jgi:hypothetical protein
MTALRCPMGCENWPNNKDYAVCPICNEKTKMVMGPASVPLTEEAAKSIKLHAEFDTFYETRWKRDESPLDPELLERIEAWPERFERKQYRPSDAEIAQNARISGIKPRSGSLVSA